MSGYLRFWFAAFLVSASLSTSPAFSFSNPFAGLFNAGPGEAAAPAPAKEECLLQPGKSTADGQHWVYRFADHRKCWFQAAVVKKPVHHHTAKQRVATHEKNKAAARSRKPVVDARAQLLRSASAEMSQPVPSARAEVVDAAPVPATGAAALVPPALVIAKSATDQVTPDLAAPRLVDVEALLAGAPSASDTTVAASAPSAMTIDPNAEANEDSWGWTATWPGLLLIGLGLVFILSSSLTRGGRVLVGRFSEFA